MSKILIDKATVKLALEALEYINTQDDLRDFLLVSECELLDNAITALRKALAEQPAQQQSCYCSTCESLSKQVTALKTCLEVERGFNVQEQPAQQEPVAWGCNRYIEDDKGFQIGTDDPELAWGKYAPDDNGWWPLYTTPQPAQRTWVGLTDEEIHAIYDEVARREPYSMAVTRRNIARAIEAKLKEKNT